MVVSFASALLAAGLTGVSGATAHASTETGPKMPTAAAGTAVPKSPAALAAGRVFTGEPFIPDPKAAAAASPTTAATGGTATGSEGRPGGSPVAAKASATKAASARSAAAPLGASPSFLAPAWTAQVPATAPQGRDSAMMAYDAATDQDILYGGYSSGFLGGTYSWNGINWTQLSPAHSPGPRVGGYMAYDAAHGYIVLFGGSNGTTDLNDTWTWNGTDWTQQSPATSPSARSAGSAAYSAALGEVIIYGGDNASGDTWAWTGTTWSQITTANSPGPRQDYGMAGDTSSSTSGDASHGNVILFGGDQYVGGTIYNDTWSFNGTNWTQLTPANSPPAMRGTSIAFDSTLNRLIMTSGEDATLSTQNVTYAWDGSTWRTAQSPTSFLPRSFATLAQAPTNTGQLMIFGGAIGNPNNGATFDNTTQSFDWAQTGNSGQYTQIPFQIDDKAQLDVNPATGNVYLSSSDYDQRSVGFDYQLSHSYNSRWNLSGDLGPNWGIDGLDDESMVSNLGGSDFYAYGITGAGTEQFFTGYNTSSQLYGTVPPALNASLKNNGDGTYTLTRHGSNFTSTFGVDGYPQDRSDADKNGQSSGWNPGTGPIGSYTYANSVTDSQISTFEYEYDPTDTYVVQVQIAGGGEQEQYGYNGSGQLASYTDNNGKTTQYGYNAAGQLSSVTSPRGDVTTLTYDAFDRVTGVTQVTNLSTGAGYTTTFSYAASNSTDATAGGTLRTTEIQPDQAGTSTGTIYVSNHAGEVVNTIDPLGHTRSASYNANADTISTQDAMAPANVYSLSYDTSNNLKQVTEPSNTGSTAASTYLNYNTPTSTNGSAYLPSSETDSSGNCTGLAYDSSGNVTDSYAGQAGGSGHTCSGTTGNDQHTDYNTAAGITKGTIKDTRSPNGNYTYYGYDSNGNLNQILYPGGSCGASRTLCTQMTYDYYQRLSTVTDGKGNVTTYSYDGDNRITQIVYGPSGTTCTPSSGNCIQYVYDADGDLTSRTDQTGSTTFSYQPTLDRLLTQTNGDGSSVTEAFDPTGLLTGYSQAFSGGSADNVTYGYNSANQLTSIVDATGTITVTPDSDGRRSKITWPGGTSISYTYNGAGDTATITPSTTNLYTLTNTYVKSGADTDLLQTQTEKQAGATVYSATFGYDSLEHLLTASNYAGTSYTYTYDADGNELTSSAVTGGTTTQGCNTVGTDDQQVAIYPSFNTTTHACTGTPNTFSRDADGQATGTSNGFVLTYSAGGDATTILQHSGGNPVSYTYSDAGNALRTAASFTVGSGTATIAYLNGALGLTARKVVNDSTFTGTTYYTRDPSGSIIDEHGGPAGSAYYETDQLGSTIALATGTGTVDATYFYDPQGSPHGSNKVASDASENPIQFTGQYFDGIEGDTFEHFGTRYYGRGGYFEQPDGQPSGITSPSLGDLYQYANGDPLNATDPTGNYCVELDVGIFTVGHCADTNYGGSSNYAGLSAGLGLGFFLSGGNSGPKPNSLSGSCGGAVGGGYIFGGLGGVIGFGVTCGITSFF